MSIYLDNAASTPMSPEVLAYMQPYFCEVFGNPSSTHSHGRQLKNILEQSRRNIATNLGAHNSEIVFTSGGTEADNLAIKGTIKGYGIKHIVSTVIEHHAVTHSIETLEVEEGVKVTWLNVDRKGNIDLDELRQVLATSPRSLVSLMHGNNEIGTLHDIAAIGEICKEYDAFFHSDTVQTMGNERYDLSQLHIHFLTASSHKFYGPKGVGFLYIRKGIKIPAMICGGSQERNMRAGTENPAMIAGMAFALDRCYQTFDQKNAHLRGLKEYMKAQLLDRFPGVSFNGEIGSEKSLPTVLNVAMPCGEEDAMLLFSLDIAGISASGGSACNSGANIGSHVLRGIQAPVSALKNSIRFSFGIQNTREEIDYTLEQLEKLVARQSV